MSFYRNGGKCAAEANGKTCKFSHEPADILKLHTELEAHRVSGAHQQFLESLRKKTSTPSGQQSATSQQRGPQGIRFASDMSRSNPGSNANSTSTIPRSSLTNIEMMGSEEDDEESA